MAVWVITGKLGGGKSLVSVARIMDYLRKGAPVATNLNLFPEKFPNKQNRHSRIIRLPDKPTSHDMELLGSGNETYDEDKNGLIVLDECGTWLNSRGWNDKTRMPLIDWFLHARKLGWDIIFIIQNAEMIDKQLRQSLAEHVVYCRRLDKMAIPFITSLLRIRPPKVHLGIVKYGHTSQHPTVDKWVYTGRQYYSYYDTKQVFLEDYSDGVYSVLTPWHLVGRYQKTVSIVEQLNKHLMPYVRRYFILPVMRFYYALYVIRYFSMVPFIGFERSFLSAVQGRISNDQKDRKKARFI